MMVNVYDYYTNKLAFEEARRKHPLTAPRRAKRKVSVPGLVQLGLASGFACSAGLTLAYCPAQPPYLLFAGTAWGVLLGYVAESVRRRFKKFMSTLNGAPMSREDLRALTGRS